MTQEILDEVNPSGAGAFGLMAVSLSKLGIHPIPTGGPDGKRALISYPHLSSPPIAPPDPTPLMKRFKNANLAVACGPSGLVVIDLDDTDLSSDATKWFGPTPIVIATPRGGFHLYYRAGNARITSRNLRTSHGLSIDIKASGGYVLAPPSLNPTLGRSYNFIQGSWECISALPQLKANHFNLDGSSRASSRQPEARSEVESVGRGQRNDWLFRTLLRHSGYCDSFDELLDVAATRNAELGEPLPDAEAVRAAKSAWKYQEEGRNWAGRSPRTAISHEEVQAFAAVKRGGDALLLYCYLESRHSNRREPIVIDRKAMAKANLLSGWTEWQYRTARDVLVDLGFLQQLPVKQANSHGRRKPNQYVLRRPIADVPCVVEGARAPWHLRRLPWGA